jgi:hypothetical protein
MVTAAPLDSSTDREKPDKSPFARYVDHDGIAEEGCRDDVPFA